MRSPLTSSAFALLLALICAHVDARAALSALPSQRASTYRRDSNESAAISRPWFAVRKARRAITHVARQMAAGGVRALRAAPFQLSTYMLGEALRMRSLKLPTKRQMLIIRLGRSISSSNNPLSHTSRTLAQVSHLLNRAIWRSLLSLLRLSADDVQTCDRILVAPVCEEFVFCFATSELFRLRDQLLIRNKAQRKLFHFIDSRLVELMFALAHIKPLPEESSETQAQSSSGHQESPKIEELMAAVPRFMHRLKIRCGVADIPELQTQVQQPIAPAQPSCDPAATSQAVRNVVRLAVLSADGVYRSSLYDEAGYWTVVGNHCVWNAINLLPVTGSLSSYGRRAAGRFGEAASTPIAAKAAADVVLASAVLRAICLAAAGALERAAAA